MDGTDFERVLQTLREDIRAVENRLHTYIVETEARLRALVGSLVADKRDVHESLERRLTSLELWRARFEGASQFGHLIWAAVGAAIIGLWHLVTWFIELRKGGGGG